MKNPYVITSGPSSEPVSTAEMKTFLRVDFTDDDTLIGTYIEAARKAVEIECGLAFMTQTRKLTLRDFPTSVENKIFLPGYPVQSITHIKYYDINGTQQTWSSSEYQLINEESDWVALKYDQDWPDHRSNHDPIEITYVCGHSSSSSWNESALLAIKLKMQIMYDSLDTNQLRRLEKSYDSMANSNSKLDWWSV